MSRMIWSVAAAVVVMTGSAAFAGDMAKDVLNADIEGLSLEDNSTLNAEVEGLSLEDNSTLSGGDPTSDLDAGAGDTFNTAETDTMLGESGDLNADDQVLSSEPQGNPLATSDERALSADDNSDDALAHGRSMTEAAGSSASEASTAAANPWSQFDAPAL